MLKYLKGKLIVTDLCPANTMFMFSTEKVAGGSEILKDVAKATNIDITIDEKNRTISYTKEK